MHAEDAYLFRHALLREAAYQLQLPSKRARLHRLAFESYEAAFVPGSRDAVALEIAGHAAASGSARLRRAERRYLERAADWLTKEFQLGRALHVCRRLAEHPHSSESQSVEWLLRATSLALQAGEFTTGLELAAQAMERAGQGPLRSRALTLSAAIHDSVGERDQALALYTRCAELALAENDKRGFARAVSAIAHVLNRAGRSGEAEDAFKRAQDAFATLQDTEGKFTLQLHYAQFLIQGGRPVEALRILEAAHAQARQGNRLPELSRILIATAVAQEQIGRPDEATRLLEEAAALCSSMNDRRSLAVVQNNLAVVWWRQGRLEQARDTYVSILALVRELGEYSEESLAIGNIASVDFHMGNIGLARAGYEAALELARRGGDLRQQLKFEGALGMILHKQGHLPEALARFDAKLELARKTRDRRAEGVALHELGEVLLDTGKRAEATAKLSAARQIFEELGDMANMKFVEEQFARLR